MPSCAASIPSARARRRSRRRRIHPAEGGRYPDSGPEAYHARVPGFRPRCCRSRPRRCRWESSVRTTRWRGDRHGPSRRQRTAPAGHLGFPRRRMRPAGGQEPARQSLPSDAASIGWNAHLDRNRRSLLRPDQPFTQERDGPLARGSAGFPGTSRTSLVRTECADFAKPPGLPGRESSSITSKASRSAAAMVANRSRGAVASSLNRRPEHAQAVGSGSLLHPGQFRG